METPIDINILDHVQIATPCTASWEEMAGTDTTRHCSHCSLNVYNISAMTSDEADALISGAEGRLCIRFYRRSDGTILTQDCPVGLRAVRQRLLRSVRNVAVTTVAMLGGMLGLGFKRASAQPSEMMGRMVMPDRARTDTTVKRDTIAKKPHIVKPHGEKSDTVTRKPQMFMGAIARSPKPTKPVPPAPVQDTVERKPQMIMGDLKMMEVRKPVEQVPPVAVADTVALPLDNIHQTTDSTHQTGDSIPDAPVTNPVDITPDLSTKPARIH
ncbi:MAG: hypothetical protein ABIR47_17485 [Candidatus Kapaibacterium sp.]